MERRLEAKVPFSKGQKRGWDPASEIGGKRISRGGHYSGDRGETWVQIEEKKISRHVGDDC